MKLAEMCRKLETEEEKVLPFFTSSFSPEEEEKVTEEMAEKPSEQLAEVKQIIIILPAKYSYHIIFKGYVRVLVLAKLLEALQQSSLGQVGTRQRKTDFGG